MKETAPPNYYTDVVECDAGCPYVKNRNTDPSLAPRYIPRGSTSRCTPGNTTLMVILANPGEPQKGDEDKQYAGKTGKELSSAAWKFTQAVCERLDSPSFPRLNAKRSVTHDNLMKHLAADVFNCHISQVLDHVVITNIVKCSTFDQNSKKEQHNFSKLTNEIQDEISTECANRHLLKEIKYWNPKQILACGKPANRILQDLKKRKLLEIDINFQTHHPSAVGRFINERKQQFIEIGRSISIHQK